MPGGCRRYPSRLCFRISEAEFLDGIPPFPGDRSLLSGQEAESLPPAQFRDSGDHPAWR